MSGTHPRRALPVIGKKATVSRTRTACCPNILLVTAQQKHMLFTGRRKRNQHRCKTELRPPPVSLACDANPNACAIFRLDCGRDAHRDADADTSVFRPNGLLWDELCGFNRRLKSDRVEPWQSRVVDRFALGHGSRQPAFSTAVSTASS